MPILFFGLDTVSKLVGLIGGSIGAIGGGFGVYSHILTRLKDKRARQESSQDIEVYEALRSQEGVLVPDTVELRLWAERMSAKGLLRRDDQFGFYTFR